MDSLSPFCTCADSACPMHPSNHDRGCAPCIAKNLKMREIPSCFFNSLGTETGRGSFFYEDFAEEVLHRKQPDPRETDRSGVTGEGS